MILTDEHIANTIHKLKKAKLITPKISQENLGIIKSVIQHICNTFI